MAKKKDTLKYVKTEIWPKTKKELEIGIKNTKKLLDKGEKYLKNFSERSAIQAKKISLGLKREKIYYSLGKIVAESKSENLSEDKKINDLIKQIRNLDKQIIKLK